LAEKAIPQARIATNIAKLPESLSRRQTWGVRYFKTGNDLGTGIAIAAFSHLADWQGASRPGMARFVEQIAICRAADNLR
jgi:hypothetical protein